MPRALRFASPLLSIFCLCSSAALAACGPSDDAKSADAGVSLDGSTSEDASVSADANTEPADLDALLSKLRSDRDGAMLDQSRSHGWPAPVSGGYLFVSTQGLGLLAGDHDSWVGTEMNSENDFYWLVVDTSSGSRYKFTDGESWLADPWSRAYAWDSEGEMSMVAPDASHLERHFQVSDSEMQARTVRVWIPQEAPTHVLYVHDGQNLFNPNAFFGGWHLNDNAPATLLIVGIDNTDQRMSEYTHVSDSLDGTPVGGSGDQYASFINTTVRALIGSHYGEPAKVGTMGSSLGGLISLHIADRFPGEYDYAASLSGTLGWGSMGGGTDTMIARYMAAGHRDTALYIDSGGNDSCTDNYCEARQMETVLVDLGYQYDVDLWHWWEPNAPHNEAAWAARVFRPVQNFMGL